MLRGGEDEEYHLTNDDPIRFKNKNYALNNEELKRLTMKEFHVKPYSVHQGYQKTLTTIEKFNY